MVCERGSCAGSWPAAATAPAPGLHGPSDGGMPCAPITWAERAGAMLLIAATVYVGLKPDVLLNWISPALQSPIMQAVLKGGTP